MEPQLKSVKAHPDHRLTLSFSNGETRIFDMSPYLDKGVFKQLKNWELFRQAKISWDTVVWPNELDIAPETLYLESKSV